jgi:fermentation-respiration switch protein FrsA (DUF1100 family)
MRMLWSVLLIIAAAYLALAAYLYVFQADYVFFPSRTLYATPADAGLRFDDVHLEAEDGVRLRGWFVPAPHARLTLLFLHGNAGNISHRLDSLRLFHELGLSSLIVDYRGYGRSAGRPSEEGTYRDAQAAWRYLVEQRRIPPQRIVVFGRSLGGGVAVWLVSHETPRALIIESTPTSIPDMGARVYPFLPVRLLARIHYDSLRRIPDVGCPILVVHSREDELIPFEHGRRLFSAAREPKAFLAIRGDHNGGFLVSGQEYVQGLTDFLDGLKAPPDAPGEG